MIIWWRLGDVNHFKSFSFLPKIVSILSLFLPCNPQFNQVCQMATDIIGWQNLDTSPLNDHVIHPHDAVTFQMLPGAVTFEDK